MFNEASVVWRYQSICSAFLQLCWRPLLYTSITAYWSQYKTRFSATGELTACTWVIITSLHSCVCYIRRQAARSKECRYFVFNYKLGILADRTSGRAYATVLRVASVCRRRLW